MSRTHRALTAPLSVAVAIPCTVRGVGLFSVANDDCYFVPLGLVDDLVSDLVGSDTSYSGVRAAAYKACASVPIVFAQSGSDEHRNHLSERLVCMRTVEEAQAHWRELCALYPDGIVRTVVRPFAKRAKSIQELAAVKPLAVTMSGPPFTVADPRTMHVTRADGRQVSLQVIEIAHELGAYVCVSGESYFVPTRVTGELMSRHPIALSGPLIQQDEGQVFSAMIAGWARLPEVIDEFQDERPFSRRLRRFASMDDAIAHRTRLAATFLLPASPRLTRPEERRLHYVGPDSDCDSHLRQATATEAAN